jgi:hypothetical protein
MGKSLFTLTVALIGTAAPGFLFGRYPPALRGWLTSVDAGPSWKRRW